MKGRSSVSTLKGIKGHVAFIDPHPVHYVSEESRYLSEKDLEITNYFALASFCLFKSKEPLQSSFFLSTLGIKVNAGSFKYKTGSVKTHICLRNWCCFHLQLY